MVNLWASSHRGTYKYSWRIKDGISINPSLGCIFYLLLEGMRLCGAHSKGVFRDFQSHPVPRIAFEHLSLYITELLYIVYTIYRNLQTQPNGTDWFKERVGSTGVSEKCTDNAVKSVWKFCQEEGGMV